MCRPTFSPNIGMLYILIGDADLRNSNLAKTYQFLGRTRAVKTFSTSLPSKAFLRMQNHIKHVIGAFGTKKIQIYKTRY